MDRQLFLASKKIMLTVVLLLAISYVQAQETKEPLTLTLDKALEIALSDNPTIKVAEEEIALKKVANKETWQSLLPEASIGGTWNHTITAAQMNLGGQSFKMGQDDSNTVSGTLNISLPLFRQPRFPSGNARGHGRRERGGHRQRVQSEGRQGVTKC